MMAACVVPSAMRPSAPIGGAQSARRHTANGPGQAVKPALVRANSVLVMSRERVSVPAVCRGRRTARRNGQPERRDDSRGKQRKLAPTHDCAPHIARWLLAAFGLATATH